MTRREQLMEEARRFDEQFPRVWKLFVQFAFEKIGFGYTRYSSDAILHRVRWETEAGDSDRADGFKINDHHTAYYARKFMTAYPQHVGFFRTREQTLGGAY